jgi:hypothetical protein
MRNNTFLVCVLAVIAVVGLFAGTVRPAEEKDVVGTWKLTYDPGNGETLEPILKIARDKSGLKAEFTDGDAKLTVKELRFQEGELHFKVEGIHNGEAFSVTYKGKPAGDCIKGEAEWDYQGKTGTFEFEGKREFTKPKE